MPCFESMPAAVTLSEVTQMPGGLWHGDDKNVESDHDYNWHDETSEYYVPNSEK